jgi:formate hydrogenlyase subunit 3/multisubunit Na+/H+ antiporter MnhD subunit
VSRTLDYSPHARNQRRGAHRAITSITTFSLALLIPTAFWIFERFFAQPPVNAPMRSSHQVVAGILCLALSPLLALVGTITAILACVRDERPRPTVVALVLMIVYAVAVVAVVLAD